MAKDDKRRQMLAKTLIENIYAACDEITVNAQIVLLLLTLHTYFTTNNQLMASGHFGAGTPRHFGTHTKQKSPRSTCDKVIISFLSQTEAVSTALEGARESGRRCLCSRK